MTINKQYPIVERAILKDKKFVGFITIVGNSHLSFI